MSISQTFKLSEPTGVDKISEGTLGYICMRNRQRQYDLVIREFKISGLTQADLARRLGKSPEVINRLLARPGNWEADTFGELMFAISGAVPAYRATYPLRAEILIPTAVQTGSRDKVPAFAHSKNWTQTSSNPASSNPDVPIVYDMAA